MYLRNWLYTLALQLGPPLPEESNKRLKKKKSKTNKRPRVVREVPRKRLRKDGLDGFVVEDENDESNLSQGWEVMADTELDGSSQSSGWRETDVLSASDVPERISEQLHNTILLTGPSGSGKTAAVFACAEELGWEVFEVYPGIGRRNGANVENLVGDVGKNHLVRRKQQEAPMVSQLSDGARSPGAGDCGDSGKIVVEEEVMGTFRQSLILLEEVDLLFKDDVNFWPAVTNLIRNCRRPVICTCNGKRHKND
jgi:DNA polymerase III delta prime subunit